MSKTMITQNLEDEYASLLAFAEEHKRLSYADFDNATLTDVNLFATPKDEHFREIEETLNKIISALPAMKRIFTKPITRLTEVYNVLPVESVRVINNHSMSHVSRHSELWGDISNGELRPKKLMTLDRQEDYAIYENVLFARLVDLILSFIRKTVRLLKDMMYATRDLSFNLLERTNHLHYFLAIGKLHLGYARAQDQDHLSYNRCLEKILFIENVIHAHLHTPVYRFCHKIKTKLSLKKTNVFRLHKDYRQVYVLLKWFASDKEEFALEAHEGFTTRDSYTAYCNMLTVFAVGHFNFQFNKIKPLHFMNLNTDASFLNWRLTLEEIHHQELRGLLLTVQKETTYRIGLIFCHNGEQDSARVAQIKEAFPAEEYFLADPWEYATSKYLYLTLFDIDSFRRIQRLLLRAMIYSDETHETCPFCGKPLTEMNHGWRCESCRTVIKKQECPTTGKVYFETEIYAYKPNQQIEKANRKNKFLTDKYTESQMFFRNITDIDFFGKSICPHCGKKHN